MTDQHLPVTEASILDDLEHLIDVIHEHKLSFALFFSPLTHDLRALEENNYSFDIRVQFHVYEFARKSLAQLRQVQLGLEGVFGRFLSDSEDRFLANTKSHIRFHRQRPLPNLRVQTPFWETQSLRLQMIRQNNYSVKSSY